VFAKRNIAHVRQVPEKLIDVTMQPLMFVLLFGFVFGGVIAVPSGDYREYLIGGLPEGIVDRFRTLPISRFSFLLGHRIAALAAMTLAIVTLSVSGLLIGWQINGSLPQALAGYALLLAFAFTMLWIGALIGVMVRSPDAVLGIGFLLVFPLTFLASTFVPIEGLPDGLQQIAEYNRVSSLAAATRELFGNPTVVPDSPAWPLAHPVANSLAWCAALLAVAVPLTVHRFRANSV
jgi:ABC-2 type transport system permease protein